MVQCVIMRLKARIMSIVVITYLSGEANFHAISDGERDWCGEAPITLYRRLLLTGLLDEDIQEYDCSTTTGCSAPLPLR